MITPARRTATVTILTMAILVSAAPFVVTLLPAFTSPTQFARKGVSWPSPFSLENFLTVLADPAVVIVPALSTTLVAVVTCVIQMTSSVCAAYAFTRLQFRGRNLVFMACIGVWLIPPTVLVVPLYLAFARAGLSGSFVALILPTALASPYALFLLRQSFESIPRELFEAAAIDGASHRRILMSVVLPVCRPALVTLVVVITTTTWNSYLWPRMIAGVQLPQVQVAIASLRTQYDDRWTVVMAASVLALLPTIALVFAIRRLIVQEPAPARQGDSP
ncbi:carbohydrate ABC transporter permease [Microbacterium sp. MAHUQ-60]|uniref:carbohydrate ABC transporter permease n=1 Tax=unclassified Microbacterium TaxID=2609290 RepID=UPI0036064E62